MPKWWNPDPRKWLKRQNSSSDFHLDHYRSRFYPHGNMQSGYVIPLQNSWTLPTFQHIRSSKISSPYFSTLVFYYFPTNSFFWPRWAALLPDSLCLKGCYPPNKQTSFIYPNPHFSKLSSNFTFSRKPSLIAQLGWDTPSLSYGSALSWCQALSQTFNTTQQADPLACLPC